MKLKDGSIKNLFVLKDLKEDYLSELGYGVFMGFFYNYEVLNLIVIVFNDGFNRLVFGFEVFVCIVIFLGYSYEILLRNRLVFVGLIRDMKNLKIVRFELRLLSFLFNMYLVIVGCY